MAERDYKSIYHTWLRKVDDVDLSKELKGRNEAQIEDAFYRDLEFGTGGLRGVIGAGTNRRNIYTVAKASQGLSNYICKHYPNGKRSVAISRDSRLKSDVFAKIAARVFAANGIEVHIYPQISPVPTLSFATRYLHCSAGVRVTASHNPSKYNGYKVYGEDGCQITTEAAAEVLSEIESIDIFKDIKLISYDEGFEKNLISYIPPKILTAFIKEVKSQSLLGNESIDKNVAIVYTPLNGTGLIPVTRTLEESGYTNITVVKEQQFPNGYFPTCPFPNPEIQEAMALGRKYAKENNADLLLATDPDCDRVGIAVRDKDGNYKLISGNQTGRLLFDYICSRRIALGIRPKEPVLVKTIVTSDRAEKIANHYHVKTVNVLTGFKYIGEQIGLLEKKGKESNYIFGFEESYGCLTGTYVRDKDAVDGAFRICERFAYYKSKGISLLDKLDELYKTYGYTNNSLHNYEFDGSSGFEKRQKIRKKFRSGIKEIGGKKVIKSFDYLPGLDGLPKADVLKFVLEDESSIIVRPSGTEPKLKAYISVTKESRQKAKEEDQIIADNLAGFFK
ncbi:MAG: phospho-sugar mutase [Candidatus Enterosoma sp.]|nr:phospho-sugar mutase [Mollicutes bacterium]MDY5851379.1 phospho-sugar mutase [Candidatus Enterosoma sp.]